MTANKIAPVGIRLRGGRHTGGLLFLSRSASSSLFARPSFCDRNGEHRDANTTADVHQDYQSARTKTQTPLKGESAMLKKKLALTYIRLTSGVKAFNVNYPPSRAENDDVHENNKKPEQLDEESDAAFAIFREFALIAMHRKTSEELRTN